MAATLIWEKRLLFSSTAGTLLAFLLQIIAICTTHWMTFTIPGGVAVNKSGILIYTESVSSGIWRVCKEGYKVSLTVDGKSERTVYEDCSSHDFFPSADELDEDKSTNIQLIDYMRTGSAFGIISLLIMFLGHVFAIYTLKRPRYIVKRLTALIHLMTAACVLVENEVFIRRIEYTAEHLPERIPKTAEYKFGFSFVLSWISFALYVVAGLIFLFTSHKRKSDMMTDTIDELAEEDEPVAIRR